MGLDFALRENLDGDGIFGLDVGAKHLIFCSLKILFMNFSIVSRKDIWIYNLSMGSYIKKGYSSYGLGPLILE